VPQVLPRTSEHFIYTCVYVTNKLVLFSIVDTSEVDTKFKAWDSKAADDKVLPSEHSNAIH